MSRPALAALLALCVVLPGCAEKAPPKTDGPGTPALVEACTADAAAPLPAWKAERARVVLNTSMGAITLALETEKAPVTAKNFLDLAGSGSYDGVAFHRVIEGFMVQTGDPNSKDDDPSDDGRGGPGYDIPDEFNPALRHDRVGVLSMANSGPNTGGSQFFITLGPTPHLDDKHSVFGEVVEGMDVVRAIGAAPTDERDRPLQTVRIVKAEVVEAAPFDASHAVGVHPLVPAKTTEPGRAATFAVVVKNTGNVRDAPAVEVEAPEGWTCSAAGDAEVAAATGRVRFVSLTPPSGASGPATVRFVAHSAWNGTPTAEATATVTVGPLGETVGNGDAVVANYAGVLPDGRLFDTSIAAVGQSADQPKLPTFNAAKPYSTFEFQVGSGVIAGFTELALTAKEGETVTALIPAAKAYGATGRHALAGRDLVFELQIVDVK